MRFESKLKHKIYKEIIDQVEKTFQRKWSEFDKLKTDDIENIVDNIINSIIKSISLYNGKKKNESAQLIFDEQDITLDSLMELKRKVRLNEDEKNYIKYINESNSLNNKEVKSIIEVLVRRILLEKLKTQNFDEFLEILREEARKKEEFSSQYSYVASLISGELFDVKEYLDNKIKDRAEQNFNNFINCGGYALEVDTCIFPGKNDFEKSVSSILDLFPFVRLVGDTKLKEDEYIVLFRTSENGHHFVKIESDGTIVEKNANQAPRKFQGWNKEFENSPEAVFAVKKEHDMEYFDKYKSIVIPIESAKNFEESVAQSINNKQNKLEYHNHSYVLKKSEEGIIYVCSNDKIVAQVLADDKNYDIEIDEQSKKYISNTEPSTMVINESEKQAKENDNVKEGDTDAR